MGWNVRFWYGPNLLIRDEVHFGFTIDLDGSGGHDCGVSIKRAPSGFDVRLPIDFVCSTSMSRPFLRVLQTAGFDPGCVKTCFGRSRHEFSEFLNF